MRLIDADALIKFIDMGHLRSPYEKSFSDSEVVDMLEAAPTMDRPQKVIAQVTFDEEKLREIMEEAVERFKEDYEIADRPQGEWMNRNPYWHTAICSNCNKATMFEEYDGKVIEYDFCPNCGARMDGKL